jgi:predicted transcriptional regulator
MAIEIGDRLDEIVELIREGKKPSATVREILRWVVAERRGTYVVYLVRHELEERNLITEPDFESVYLDSEVEFVLSDYQPVESTVGESKSADDTLVEETAANDAVQNISIKYAHVEPAYKVSRLEASNRPPIYIAPDASISDAITIMLTNGFSQLPVMTSEREVKGVISWYSIGSKLALGKSGTAVRELMDDAQEIKYDDSIFLAIDVINQLDYVLVRGSDKKITGILTATDLNYQLKQVSESFMLLSEIENYIRKLIEPKFSKELLNLAKDPNDVERIIESVSDMTFGEYVRLLENQARWDMLGIKISRHIFCSKVDEARKIRNDVMHFDPDGIPADKLKSLRDFSAFLQKLHKFSLF